MGGYSTPTGIPTFSVLPDASQLPDGLTLKTLNGAWVIGEDSVGVPGAQFRTGNGEPAGDLGLDGDSYVDLNTGILWAKSSGIWSQQIDLIDSTGGPIPSENVIYGSTVPTSADGVDGQFYVRVVNNKPYSIYGPKTAGLWGRATALVALTVKDVSAVADGIQVTFSNGSKKTVAVAGGSSYTYGEQVSRSVTIGGTAIESGIGDQLSSHGLDAFPYDVHYMAYDANGNLFFDNTFSVFDGALFTAVGNIRSGIYTPPPGAPDPYEYVDDTHTRIAFNGAPGLKYVIDANPLTTFLGIAGTWTPEFHVEYAAKAEKIYVDPSLGGLIFNDHNLQAVLQLLAFRIMPPPPPSDGHSYTLKWNAGGYAEWIQDA